MKKLLPFILICLALNSFGQNFYFPKTYYTDSTAISTYMPQLAKQVIALYKESDKQIYFDNLFRFQITAKQYGAAGNSLDSFRLSLKTSDSMLNKAISFQYQTFVSAKMRQIEREIPFTDAYSFMFPRLFNALPNQESVVAANNFVINVNEVRDSFYKLLNNQKDKEIISFDDAKILCRAYNSYHVYSQIIHLAKPLIVEQDNQQFIIEDTILIKTRDGAAISATVIRKKNITTKQPTVFVFNIYTGPIDKTMAKEAAINGYVGVVANTRGKKLSSQEIEPFEHDAADAYDIIDWISKQPWSNGKVGMFGGSYLGFSQWAAAKKLHPALKTIIPQVAVGIGIDYPLHNNVFMSYMLRWIHFVTNSKETDRTDFNNQKHWDSVYNKWYVSGKSFRALDTIEKRPSKIFQRWLLHPGYDTYWQNMVAYKNDFAKINIPVLTTTGYYDADQLGALYYFNQHHLHNKNAEHYLVIGPYDHSGAQSIPYSVIGGYRIDSVAKISITDLAYKWFNYILKDSAKPSLLKDRINYQVMGANQWKHAPSLSKMNNDTINFYLSNVRLAQHYKLDMRVSSTPGFIRQEIDFKDRSDSNSQFSANIIDSLLDVSNGLSFISMPFNKPFELNGSFVGELNASINKKDLDISIAMYELTSNGKHFMLGTYITRASYAKNRSQRQLLQPGKKETIPINNSFFMSKKINAGSKLVIVLSINKNHSWQINYGTGKDVSDETIDDAKDPLKIKWFNSSVIKIPVWK